jgi:hypothetical protein
MADAEDRAARKEDRALKKILADMQLEEMTRKRSDEDRKRQGIQQFTDMVNPTAQALSGGGGPTPANAAKLPDQKSLQYFSMLQSGLISPQDFLTATTPKDPEVKDFKEVRNPDGSVSIVGFTKDGKVINTSQTPFKAPEVRDFGGFVAGVNPITGEVMRYGDKTQSPDSRASNAVQWANHNLSRERFTFDQNQGVKPTFNADVGGFVYPPDMRNPNGRVVPVEGASKPPNEGQGRAVLFGTRMARSNEIMNNLEAQGVTPSWTLQAADSLPLIGGLARVAANAGPTVSKNEQLYDQAKRDFINAVLRRESGAVIGEDEFKSADKQYFPQPGDSAAVREQKRKNRETAIQGIVYEAGPHAKVINRPKEPTGASPADAAALQWARSNPNDPRATAILQRLGVQ